MCHKKIFDYIVIIGILSFIVLSTALFSSIKADDYVDPNIFGGGVSSSSSSSSSTSSSSSGGGSGGCKVEPGTERYCKDCGPCWENQGMCFIDEDCVAGLICSNHTCVRSTNPSSSSSGGAGCKTTPGSERYCTDCGPCSEGQGACFNNSECATGLVCNSFGICISSTSSGGCQLQEGTLTYCGVCGPCSEGQSVCFKDSECVSGLVCNSKGFCVRSGYSGCGVGPIPREGYCNLQVCGPCRENEGWCKNNSECDSGLVCSHSLCVRSSNPSSSSSSGGDGCQIQEGTLTYCAVCGPCSENQSVCHKNSECALGLVCSNNGFCVRSTNPSSSSSSGGDTPSSNTCKVPVGSDTYCADCGPCREGQGKCSKDTDCIKGLVCSNHTGLCKKP
jgi:hypothetical protein